MNHAFRRHRLDCDWDMNGSWQMRRSFGERKQEKGTHRASRMKPSSREPAALSSPHSSERERERVQCMKQKVRSSGIPWDAQKQRNTRKRRRRRRPRHKPGPGKGRGKKQQQWPLLTLASRALLRVLVP
ncbi:hypothetical protein Mp_3g04990 [Marchantia polymorpha subsp. ruderalis]|uniref:Uncharacterized protein n=2 Tax=Marchantia polymorpha TaxID=3197 RepID=A0AAF6AXJ5_MARPO|nr:hypothetical protein MARPO_0022s0030 [Marchantia polymorpha]BBN04479.1 hypothetical protein Mp_3g04990 [Marchantia polymorpha subsp. ruderalis]|eukprot:PTQ43923.1 hypothetical protein MARPO_0022s0030 [Marchantia polymorpha]